MPVNSIAKAINPIKIARAINPVSAGKSIMGGIRNPGNPELGEKAITAGKDFTYWFGGLIGIAVGVLNPLLMYRQYKNKGVPEKERNALVVQEAANQAVNVVVHMICYFGLSALVSNRMMKIPGINKDLVDITKIMVANIGGFLGQGVVRPILGSTILMKWKDKQAQKEGSSGKGADNASAQAGDSPKMEAAPSAAQQQQEDQQLQELLRFLEQQEQLSQQAPAMPPQQAPAAPVAPIAPPVPPKPPVLMPSAAFNALPASAPLPLPVLPVNPFFAAPASASANNSLMLGQ